MILDINAIIVCIDAEVSLMNVDELSKSTVTLSISTAANSAPKSSNTKDITTYTSDKGRVISSTSYRSSFHCSRAIFVLCAVIIVCFTPF